MTSVRAATDSFLRSPPNSKPFSIISDAVFTEANKVLDAFVKDLRKTGKIAGVVHKKAVSKDQIQRPFESGELGPANSQNPAHATAENGMVLSHPFLRTTMKKNQRQLNPGMLSLSVVFPMQWDIRIKPISRTIHPIKRNTHHVFLYNHNTLQSHNVQWRHKYYTKNNVTRCRLFWVKQTTAWFTAQHKKSSRRLWRLWGQIRWKDLYRCWFSGVPSEKNEKLPRSPEPEFRRSIPLYALLTAL